MAFPVCCVPSWTPIINRFSLSESYPDFSGQFPRWCLRPLLATDQWWLWGWVVFWVSGTYCWWKKSCTRSYGKYTIIYRVSYMSGGVGFLPQYVSVFGSSKAFWRGGVLKVLLGGFKHVFIFTPIWENDPFWLIFYFSNGLKPPTSFCYFPPSGGNKHPILQAYFFKTGGGRKKHEFGLMKKKLQRQSTNLLIFR